VLPHKAVDRTLSYSLLGIKYFNISFQVVYQGVSERVLSAIEYESR